MQPLPAGGFLIGARGASRGTEDILKALEVHTHTSADTRASGGGGFCDADGGQVGDSAQGEEMGRPLHASGPRRAHSQGALFMWYD